MCRAVSIPLLPSGEKVPEGRMRGSPLPQYGASTLPIDT